MTDQPIEGQRKHPWDDTLRTLIIAVLLAVTFRSFAYEPFHIPSGSMKNNLLVGDYLFVSKYAYGYSRYSFPFGFPAFSGRTSERRPERGDVVVFRLPSNPRIDYIKRVMGLPGDRIQVKSGVVTINGEPLPRRRAGEYADDEPKSSSCLVSVDAEDDAGMRLVTSDNWEQSGGGGQVFRSIPRFAETLPEGKVIHILKECRRSTADDTRVFKVPPGHYFMMGDNRDNSRDSRFYEVGFVPEQNLVGRAEIIFFSTDGTLRWLNPVSWFTALRPDRFFTIIE